MPYTTRELLARLIKCEAGGEGDDGMAAVASVAVSYTHLVSRRLSDDKACDYRHLSKGTGIQKHKREKRNVCG